jgi:hypothetical protein
MQKELKVPKEQYNSFAKYKYRSCEDIVEAVKKALPEGTTITLSDDVQIFGGHLYIKATARLSFDKEFIEATGWAREALDKKGMDAAQMTGTASSYARKYALNGLFAIDDTKDGDTDEYQKKTKPAVKENITAVEKEASATKYVEEYLQKLMLIKSVESLEQLQKDNLEQLQRIQKGYPKLAITLAEKTTDKMAELGI